MRLHQTRIASASFRLALVAFVDAVVFETRLAGFRCLGYQDP